MMETLVVVSQHRNQHCGMDVDQIGQPEFDIGSPSPCKSFREINCRTFQSSRGLVSTPFNYFHVPSPPVTDQATGFGLKALLQSTPIAIPVKVPSVEKDDGITREEFVNRKTCYSERWAGPTYSNSPPPSSLPIPKFSLRSKRTTSLDLPCSTLVTDGFSVHSVAKSAPTSPRIKSRQYTKALFYSTDSATQTLRRILNLDDTD